VEASTQRCPKSSLKLNGLLYISPRKRENHDSEAVNGAGWDGDSVGEAKAARVEDDVICDHHAGSVAIRDRWCNYRGVDAGAKRTGLRRVITFSSC